MPTDGKPTPILLMVRELNLGGCERDVTKVASNIDKAKYKPFVGCFHPDGFRGDELRAAGIPIVRFAVSSFRSPSYIRAARHMGRFLREEKIELVHTFDVPTNIFGVPVARWYGVRAVIASHLWYRNLVPPAHRRMHRIVDKLAHRIVVNSDAVRRSLETDPGIPSSRTYLCRNGVETEIFHPAADPGSDRLKDASLVIGIVCALRAEKRVDLLMEAFAKVRGSRPGLKLLIVGSGDMLPALEAKREELSLGSDCIMEPAKPNVADWMRKMDIFVLSSESESFPNALLEAMACGCSVVASKVGGVPELVTHGVDGLMFSNGNLSELTEHLNCLVNNDSLRRKLGTQAYQTAHERFAMKIATQCLERLYGEMLR